MKRTWIAVAMFMAFGVRAEGLQALAWMAGSWMERKGGATTEEHWLPPSGGLMIAMFQIPNKFFAADGRITDQHGRDWDELWGEIISFRRA